jgi:hypothetical protein
MSGANSSPGIIGPGKMRSSTIVLSPLLIVSRGFFVTRIKNKIGGAELPLGLLEKFGRRSNAALPENILCVNNTVT